MATPHSTETWNPVVGHEGRYEVSDLGQVRSIDRYDANGRLMRGKTLSPKTQSGGYLVVNLWHQNKGTMRYVHRLVLESFRGARDDMQGCHNDGDQKNNHLDNLRWGTASDNAYDRVAHGTHAKTSRTHCPRGHRLIEPNLIPHKLATYGYRACRACGVEWSYSRGKSMGFSTERADRWYAGAMSR